MIVNVRKLFERLWDVPGAYAAFVAGVIRYASTAEYRRDKVLEYLDANPDATTSNIVKFVMEQDDFHEAAESTIKNKMISEADDVFIPEVVEVTPHDNYVVEVLFQDGKAVSYDVSHLLDKGAFSALKDTEFYRSRCTVMNHTLAWDLTGECDPEKCLDIDPYIIYYGENDMSSQYERCQEIGPQKYLSALETVLANHFPANRYHIGGYQEAAVCLEKETDGWTVYSGERGNRYNEIQCDTILMACLQLFRRLSHKAEDVSATENEFIRRITEER